MLSGLPLLFLLVAGLFFSCSEPPSDTGHSLTVTPSEPLLFRACGNEDAALVVVTDAEAWNCTAPEWALLQRQGNVLEVNVRDNATGTPRTGRLDFTAGDAAAVGVKIIQAEAAQGEIVLDVTPWEQIVFYADGNETVELTVATNAAEWTYEVPEWLDARRDGDCLLLDVRQNDTGVERSGEVVISAGPREIRIAVIHRLAPDPSRPVPGVLKDETGRTDVPLPVGGEESVTAYVRLELEQALESASWAEVAFDAAYIEEYNALHGTDYRLFPAERVSLAGNGRIEIPAYRSSSDAAAVALDLGGFGIAPGESYLVPLRIVRTSDNISVGAQFSRVNYLLTRSSDKEVRNVLFFEVNDVNPLNALEYEIEDGRMFFDAVVLFAANIRYNEEDRFVYLHNNPNVQALLDETDTFLQPLRKRGIKVYLGLLGDHTPAGLGNLSAFGAREWAREVAEAVRKYRLDGVSLDDEYTRGTASSEWLTTPSPQAASRLCRELKLALTEACPWQTDVSVYQYGMLRELQTVEGHAPGEFVDLLVADYGFTTRPAAGMTLRQCSGKSLQLNRGGTISEEEARGIRDKGYGWLMWFAFNPAPGMKNSNFGKTLPKLQAAARGLYGAELIMPAGYYKKVGEGRYDPLRYEF